jgi:hypothetical protein
MSDLAPFVAAVLHDRVLAETKQEVDHLSEQLQKSRAVQIISESGTVYAEGRFQDGSYSDNPNLWLVNLKNLASCPLSDLAGAEIFVGGICKAHFGPNSIVEGFVERDDDSTYMDGWGFISFCFGDTGQCWLSVYVGPFPSEVAFFSQVPNRDIVHAEDLSSFLTEELAENHPELSVTFEHVEFYVSAVRGLIQNLNLDPAIEEEAQRREEDRNTRVLEAQRRRALAAVAAAAENGVDDGTDDEDDEDDGEGRRE